MDIKKMHFVVVSLCFAFVHGQFQPIAEPQPALLPRPEPIIGDKLVAFISGFIQAVKEPGRLQDVFAGSLAEIKEIPDIFYKIIQENAVRLETPFPDEMSRAGTDATLSVKDILTPVSLAKVLAAATGRELNDYGHLTSIEHSVELSRIFTRHLNEAVSRIGEEDNNKPGKNSKAITMGAFSFFKSLDLINPRMALSYMYYFIDEFYALRIYS